MAPLPNHETVLSGDPSNGLADYFSRSADEVSEYEDRLGILSLGARNELPPPPPPKSGRINRSMDERRTRMPLWQLCTQ